jgi:DNA repair exonuclease SbcCD ATPase subunit
MDIINEIEFLTEAYKKAKDKSEFVSKMVELYNTHQISKNAFDTMLGMVANSDALGKKAGSYVESVETQNEELIDKLACAEEEIEQLRKDIKKLQKRTLRPSPVVDPCSSSRSTSRC